MMKFFFAEFLYSSKISVSEDGISGISPEDGISISESSEEEVVRIFFFPEVIKETDFNLAPRELVRDFGFSDSTEEERGLIIELALCDFFCDFVGVVEIPIGPEFYFRTLPIGPENVILFFRGIFF